MFISATVLSHRIKVISSSSNSYAKVLNLMLKKTVVVVVKYSALGLDNFLLLFVLIIYVLMLNYKYSFERIMLF